MPETEQQLKGSERGLDEIIRERKRGLGLNLDVQQKSDTISGGTEIGAIVGDPKIVHNDNRRIVDTRASENSYQNLVKDLPLECAPGYLESIDRAPGTCEWILKEDQFKKWLDGDGIQILWLLGGPGTGKTVLSSYIINHIKARIETISSNNKTATKSESAATLDKTSAGGNKKLKQESDAHLQETLAFCLSDPGDSTRNTAGGILGALLRQFLRDQWDLLPQAERRFADQLKVASSNMNALLGILLAVLKDLRRHFRAIFLIVDGLDGCDSASGKLFIRCLHKFLGHVNTRILVTSQEFEWIVDELDGNNTTADGVPVITRLDIRPPLLKACDIERVIRYKFPKLNLQKYLEEEIKNKLEDHLIKESGETFLWADLVIKDLEMAKGALRDLEFSKILDKFRGTLQEAYGRILNDICRRRVEAHLTLDEVEFVLQFVAVAKRQLTPAEIDRAYSIWKTGDNDDGRVDEDGKTAAANKASGIPTESTIINIKGQKGIYESCRPLVSLNPETKLVELMHKSVGEYLLNSRSYYWLRMIRCIRVLLSVVSAVVGRYFVVLYLQINPALVILGAFSGWDDHDRGGGGQFYSSSPSSSSRLANNPPPRVTKRYQRNLAMANSLALDVCLRSLGRQGQRAREKDTNHHHHRHREEKTLSITDSSSTTNSDSKSENEKIRENNRFVEYVTKHWQDHALAVDPERAISRLLKLCGPPNIATLRDSLLLRAAEHGCVAVLRVLLREMGANITAEDEFGKTALHLAAFGGHLEVVRLLVKHGADLNKRDGMGAMPIHLAAGGGQMEILTCLFDLHREEERRKRRRQRSTTDHIGPWRWFAWSTSIISQRFPSSSPLPRKKLPADEMEMPDDEGGTLLAWAVEGGSEKVVRYLMENGAKPDVSYFRDLRRTGGNTSRVMSLDVFEEIFDLFSDFVYGKSMRQRTPLSRAAELRNQDIVELLLDFGADPNFRDGANRTAIFWAAKRGGAEIIRILKRRGANCNSQLFPAVIAEDAVAVKNLIQIGDADPNLPGALDTPVLSWAAVVGNKSVMEALLDSPRANINVKGGKLRITPLILAAVYNKVAAVEYLVARGADVNMSHAMGGTPLMVAAREGSNAAIEKILTTTSSSSSSSPSSKVNLGLSDYAGRTALMEAAAVSNETGFRLLFEKDNDSDNNNNKSTLNRVDRLGRPVIFHAIRGGSRQIIDLLLSNPTVNTGLVDFYGGTLLSMAARFGDNTTIRKLFQSGQGRVHHHLGVVVVARDKFGRSPVMWAALKGHSSTKRLLLEEYNNNKNSNSNDKSNSNNNNKTLGGRQLSSPELEPELGDDEFTPVIIPSGSTRARPTNYQRIRQRQPPRRGFCDTCFFNMEDRESFWGCKKCIGGYFGCCCECWETLRPRPYCLRRDHQLGFVDRSKDDEDD